MIDAVKAELVEELTEGCGRGSRRDADATRKSSDECSNLISYRTSAF